MEQTIMESAEKKQNAASQALNTEALSGNFFSNVKMPSLESILPSVIVDKFFPKSEQKDTTTITLPSLDGKKNGDAKPAEQAVKAPEQGSAQKEGLKVQGEQKDANTAPKDISQIPKLTPREFRNGADIAFGGIDFDQNSLLSAMELSRTLKYPFEGETPEMKLGVSLMNKHFDTFKMMDNKDGISLPGIHKIEGLASLQVLPSDSPLYFHAQRGAYVGGTAGFLLGAVPSYGIGKLAYSIAASVKPGLAPLIGLAAGAVTELISTGIGAGVGYKKGRESDNADYENGQKAKLKALLYDLKVSERLTKE